jgi:hypothetical protein
MPAIGGNAFNGSLPYLAGELNQLVHRQLPYV